MNSSNVIENASGSNPKCLAIEQLLLDPFYQIATWIQLLIVLSIFILIIALIRQYLLHKLTLHGNLLILFANLVFIYFFNSFFWFVSMLRYKILTYTYATNCDLLTPVWLSFCFTCPSYIYLIAFSVMHLFVMAERLRATKQARQYENEGIGFGWIGVIVTWAVSIIFITWAILTALADTDAFSEPLGVLTLTSKYNAQGIIYSYYVLLICLFATVIGDYWVKVVNSNLRKRDHHGFYSLSKTYQVKENLLTMKMILPLDLSYAVLFSIYVTVGLVLRYYRSQMSTTKYVAYYNMAVTLLLLHSAITLFIYNKFIKLTAVDSRRRNAKIEQPQRMDDYFKQLANQWK